MAPLPPNDRRGFEIAIICALPLEAGLVEAVFDKFWEDEDKEYGKALGDQNSYTTGVIGEYNVVLAHMPGMGKVNAATVASSLRISFPAIKLALIVGICGGVPTTHDNCEIVLGDVIVSQKLVQYDFGRQYPSAFERKDTVEDVSGRTNSEIRAMLAKAQTPRGRERIQIDTAAYLQALQKSIPTAIYPGVELDNLYESDYIHKHHSASGEVLSCKCKEDSQICSRASKRSCEEVKCDPTRLVARKRLAEVSDLAFTQNLRIHFGAIGSADTVMKSGELRDRLARVDKIIAFEMEGTGVSECFPSIVVKGVTDYADSHKNKRWQEFAAAVAACCMKALLGRMTPEDRLERNAVAADPSSVWHVPFDRLPRIHGRDKEINILQEKLFTSNGSHIAAIFGLGGTGKSRIAWEIANSVRSSGEPYSVFWIQASSIHTIERDVQGIGRKLKIPGLEIAEDPKRLVKRYLESENSGSWLLILDNADDEAIWSPTQQHLNDTLMAQVIPHHVRGSILITTRSRRIAANLAGSEAIHLQQLNAEDAVQTLENLLIDGDNVVDHNTTFDLVTRLSCLPLAIVQAAAYVNMNGTTISDYIVLLKNATEEGTLRLLNEDFEDRSRYSGTSNSIASTWLVSFEHIQQYHPKACETLSFMSCLDEKSICRSLLQFTSEEENTKVLGVLVNYSFVKRHDSTHTLDPMYSMHRLVRLATRSWLRSQNTLQEWTETAIQQVEKCSPYPKYEAREIWVRYLPHAQILCSEAYHENFLPQYSLRQKIALWSSWTGRFREGVNMLRPIAYWAEKNYGEKHPFSIESDMSLGEALRMNMEYTDAELYLSKAYRHSQDAYGLDHSATRYCRKLLAKLHYHQRKLGLAEALLLEVIGQTGRGRDSEDIMADEALLAQVYTRQKRWIEAEELMVKVLAVQREALGLEHPDTLLNMSRLARIYRNQDRLSEAEDLQTVALENLRKVMGPEHPATLNVMVHMAYTLTARGSLTEAESLWRELFESCKERLGLEHRKTLQKMAVLAQCLKSQGRSSEALSLMSQCTEICNSRYGTNDSESKKYSKKLDLWRTDATEAVTQDSSTSTNNITSAGSMAQDDDEILCSMTSQDEARQSTQTPPQKRRKMLP